MLGFVLKFLWPFLKEMILGDRTLKEAIRHHKWRVFVIGIILTSIVLNFLTIPRLFSLAHDHVELQRKYDAVRKQRWPEADIEVDPPMDTQPVPTEPSPPPTNDASAEQYRRSKEFFEQLRKQETGK